MAPSVRCVGCCWQVLLDWVKGRPLLYGGDGDQPLAGDIVQSRLQRMLTGHLRLSVVGDARKQIKLSRMPNMLMLLSHEHALTVGCGLALDSFLPPAPLGPLAEGERRYAVAAEQLPADAVQCGQKERSCIKNERTGQRRLEITYSDVPRALHLRVDQGSIGWPSAYFLFVRAGISGSFHWDPAHRFHNDVKLACVASDLWLPIVECTLAFNLPQGPWQKAGFFRKACQCAEDFFTQNSPTHPTFIHFFEQMAMDLDPQSVMAWGSEHHLQHVWDLARSHCTWFRKGLKIKLCRWMSFWDRATDMLTGWTVMLFGLSLIGLEEGWLAKVSDLDFAHTIEQGAAPARPGATASASSSSSGAPAVAPSASGVAAPPEGAVAEPRGVQHSNAEVERLRKQCKNTCHVACKILGNMTTCMIIRAMTFAMGPVRSHFGKALVKMGNRLAGVQWLAGMAAQEWQEELGGIVAVLGDQTSLQQMRFELGEATSENSLVARCLVRFVCNLLGKRLLTLTSFGFALPMKFACLLHAREEVRTSALAVLKDWWSALCDLEVCAQGRLEAKRLLSSLAWPFQWWARKIFIQLSEFRFETVPPQVHEQLMGWATCMLTTKPSEDAFKLLRDAEAAHPDHQLSRVQRFRVCMQSEILANTSRPPVQSTPAAAAATKRKTVPQTLFEADAGAPFTLGAERLKDFSEGPACPSPGAYNLVHLGWLAWLQSRSIDAVEAALFSKLLNVGCVVANAESRHVYMVVASSVHCVLAWRLRLVREGTWTHLVLHDVQDCPWEPLILTTHDGPWLACDYTVIDPQQYSHKLQSLGLPVKYAIVLSLEGHPRRPPLAHAAMHTFVDFTAAQLGRLHKLLKVPYVRSRPTRERDLLRALTKFALPDMPDERVEELVKQRVDPKPGPAMPSILLEGDNVKLLDGVLEEDDAQDITNYVEAGKRSRQATSKEQRPAAPQASAAGGAASSSAKASGTANANRRPLPIPAESSFSIEEAKALKPPGATLSLERTWHSRWRVEIAGQRFSKTFGGVISERSALMKCLRWAWDQAFLYDGVECPWELDDGD